MTSQSYNMRSLKWWINVQYQYNINVSMTLPCITLYPTMILLDRSWILHIKSKRGCYGHLEPAQCTETNLSIPIVASWLFFFKFFAKQLMLSHRFLSVTTFKLSSHTHRCALWNSVKLAVVMKWLHKDSKFCL